MSTEISTCPRCNGAKVVKTYLLVSGRRTKEELFPCPTCHAEGLASEEDVRNWEHYKAAFSAVCICGKQAHLFPQENSRGEVSYFCRKCGKRANIKKAR